MSAVPKLADKKSLKNLVPLNGLSSTHFEELAKKANVLELKPGKYLFKKGERDNSTCFILEGEIALVDGSDIKLTIEGGTEEARHPIAAQQPRQLGARAKSHCTIVSIDSGLLDVMLAWEQSSGFEVDEVDADDEDWMTRMMQSDLMLKLPANNLQQLFMRMEEVEVKSGEVVVNQDDDGDYYYIIKQGTAIVSRRPSVNAREVKLAELEDGDSFGEESLLSGAKRNASVTMLTDGNLMRLSKNDFNELLKAPLLSQLSYGEARKHIDEGAVFLDVRLPGEYNNAHLQGSINMPLAAIRSEITSIDRDKEYIVYCDTGRRSTSAVFLLGQFGIDAHVLQDGLSNVPLEDYTPVEDKAVESAEIIDINRERTDSGERPGNAELQEVRQEKAQLEENVNKLVAEVDSLKEQISKAEQKITQQESELQKTQASVQQEQDNVASMEEELQSLRDLEIESDKLKEQLRKAQGAAEEQEKLLSTVQQSDESSQKKMLSQQADIERLEKELQAAIARAAEADAVHTANISELDALRSQMDELSAEKNRLAEQLQGIEREKEALGKDVDASVSALNEEISTLRTTLAELQESKSSLEKDLQHERQQLEDKTNDKQALDEQIAELSQALDEEKKQAEQMQSDNAARIAELETLRAKLDGESQTSHGQISELQQQIDDVQKQKTQLQQELQISQARISSLESDIQQQASDKASKLSDSEQATQQLQSSLQESEQQRQQLKSEINALNDQLQEHESSLASLKEASEKEKTASLDRIKALESELEKTATEYGTQVSSMQAQLSEYEEQQRRLQAEIETLIEQSADYAAKLVEEQSNYEQQNQANQTTISDLKTELETAVRESELRETALQAQLAESGDMRRLMEAEIKSVKDRADKNEAMYASEKQVLEQDNLASQQVVTELKSELDTLKQQKNDLESGLQGQLSESEGVRQQQAQEIERLTGRIEEYEARLTSERENAENQSKESVARVSELETDLHNVRNEMAALEQARQELQQSAQQNSEELEQSKVDRLQMESQLESVNAELDALRNAQSESEQEHEKQVIEYRQKLELQKIEHAAVDERYQRAQKRIDELVQINTQLESGASDEAMQNELQGLRTALDDAENKLQGDASLLAEKTQESDEVRKELAALRAVYVQKESELSELQREVEAARNTISGLNQQDDDALKAKQAAEQELDLVRQSFTQAENESKDIISGLQQALQEKEKLIEEYNSRASETESLRFDAESAYKVMEEEVEKLRHESEEYQRSLGNSHDQLQATQLELEKFKEEQKNWRITEQDLVKANELEMSRARVKELEDELLKSRNEHDQATAKIESLESVQQKDQANLEHELQGKVEQLKRDMESQLDKYKSELDDESGKLRKENEKLRDELANAYKEHEIAIQTGRPVADAKQTATDEQVENSAETQDHSALFNLPDIDKNLFSADTTRVVAKSNTLLIVVMVLLFSLMSAGGVYWYFVMNKGGQAMPVSSTQDSSALNSQPVVKTPLTDASGKQGKLAADVVKQKPQSKPVKPLRNKPKVSPVIKGVLKPTRVFSDFLESGGNGPVMVGVPGGIFTMGSPDNSTHFNERPQHKVSIRKFSIAKYEVSFDDYDRFAEETGRPRPSDNGWGRGKRPVINVTWEDAVAYTQWLSEQTGHEYRLPSEAEWEYAARAGGKDKYWWGNEYGSNRANCFNCGSKWDKIGSAPVGSFAASSLGLHDMSGNVMEWVSDCYHKNYDGAPIDGTVWSQADCSQRVVRGGSYHSTVDDIRSSKRNEFSADTAVDHIGFRVVRVR